MNAPRDAYPDAFEIPFALSPDLFVNAYREPYQITISNRSAQGSWQRPGEDAATLNDLATLTSHNRLPISVRRRRTQLATRSHPWNNTSDGRSRPVIRLLQDSGVPAAGNPRPIRRPSTWQALQTTLPPAQLTTHWAAHLLGAHDADITIEITSRQLQTLYRAWVHYPPQSPAAPHLQAHSKIQPDLAPDAATTTLITAVISSSMPGHALDQGHGTLFGVHQSTGNPAWYQPGSDDDGNVLFIDDGHAARHAFILHLMRSRHQARPVHVIDTTGRNRALISRFPGFIISHDHAGSHDHHLRDTENSSNAFIVHHVPHADPAAAAPVIESLLTALTQRAAQQPTQLAIDLIIPAFVTPHFSRLIRAFSVAARANDGQLSAVVQRLIHPEEHSRFQSIADHFGTRISGQPSRLAHREHPPPTDPAYTVLLTTNHRTHPVVVAATPHEWDHVDHVMRNPGLDRLL